MSWQSISLYCCGAFCSGVLAYSADWRRLFPRRRGASRRRNGRILPPPASQCIRREWEDFT